MPVNMHTPNKWTIDIIASVDQYNAWFMEYAPKTFREIRLQKSGDVEHAFILTSNLTHITPELLLKHPQILQILRMTTCPPIARDRLVGLANVSKNLVESMEDALNPKIPQRMGKEQLDGDLRGICDLINSMIDPDIFIWLNRAQCITNEEKKRATSIIADRLCGAVTDPLIRNEQEKRQLGAIDEWLKARGYKYTDKSKYNQMNAGTYSFRTVVPVAIGNSSEDTDVNIPIDVVIMPKKAQEKELPLLIEAKSAGDATNVNKRRKEEAQKMTQLRNTYGQDIRFILFLCGYFNTSYLKYEAAEGIDWVWEHRIDDLALFGL